MLRRVVLVSLLGLFVQLALSSSTPAQMPSGCLITTIWYFPDPRPFGWSYYGPGQGPFSYIISAMSFQCVPPVSEPCPKCKNESQPAATNPISLSTGNTFIEQGDIRIPGLGGGLSLLRTWNSTWPVSQATMQIGLFGSNWRSTYEERIYTGADGYLKYSRSDGSFWSFGYDTASSKFRVAAPANISATMSQGSSYTTLAFKNGEQRRFDNTSGNLIAILDRNGNTTSLTYDGSGRLVTVTDAAGRYLTFNYGSPSSHIVSGITSSVGISVSYTYDGQGRLALVTEQDLSTLNFAYNAQSLITQVTDSLGKILESHTYDSTGRGLSGSKANGVESVTITYP